MVNAEISLTLQPQDTNPAGKLPPGNAPDYLIPLFLYTLNIGVYSGSLLLSMPLTLPVLNTFGFLL